MASLCLEVMPADPASTHTMILSQQAMEAPGVESIKLNNGHVPLVVTSGIQQVSVAA